MKKKTNRKTSRSSDLDPEEREEKDSEEEEYPAILSLLPVRELVPFPGLIFPIYVTSESNIKAVNYALEMNNLIALTVQKGEAEAASKNNLYRIGAIARLVHSTELSSGDIQIRLHIEERIKIRSFLSIKPFVRVRVSYFEETMHTKLSHKQEQLLSEIHQKFVTVATYDESIEEEALELEDFLGPGEYADFLCSHLPLDPEVGQRILEERSPFKRLDLVEKELNKRLEDLDIRERIITKAREQLGVDESEGLLREQLRQIQVELGIEEEFEDEVLDLKKQIKQLKMPAVARKEAERQLRRLQLVHADSSEAALARTYLGWLLEVPWTKKTKDRIDLNKAKEILDEDHYGLDKAKERRCF